MDGQNFNEASTGDNTGSSQNALAIVSLVLGILAIVTGCCITYLGIILGIAAIVCAVISNKKGKSGLATAGLVCGIVGIVLAVIWIVVSIVFGAAMLESLSSMGYY